MTTRADRFDEESPDRSDEQLVEAVRSGDSAAYATLWQRHAPAARRAARAITSTFDPDDIVSEAFASVLTAIRAGGGPTESFRPYLFATIRNVTAMWGRKGRPLALDALPEHVLTDGIGDPFESMSERSTIVQVFRSLPVRHRTLLWYLEVEGMKPREIAPLMGLTPNAVSALSYRAREGFRQAWLTAHIADPGRPEECRWFCERVVVQGRRVLARADTARFNAHLRTCRGCQIVAADVENVSRRLRAILLPLVLGGSAATAYLADSAGDAASAAAAPVAADTVGAEIPIVRHAPGDGIRIIDGAPATSRATTRLPAGVALAATLTTAAVAVAGAVLMSVTGALSTPPPRADPLSTVLGQREAAPAPSRAPLPAEPPVPSNAPSDAAAPSNPQADDVLDPSPAPRAPGAAPAPRGPGQEPRPTPSTIAGPPADVEFGFTGTILDGTTVPEVLAGAGTPGAEVTVSDENGVVLVVTTVAEDGTFTADVSGSALHQGMSIRAVQRVPGEEGAEHAPVIGPVTFAVPLVAPASPRASAGELNGDVLDDRDPDGASVIRLRLSGASGAWVAVASDGGEQRVVRLVDGLFEGEIAASHDASHRVAVRYIDPATGRAGVLADYHVVMAASPPVPPQDPHQDPPPAVL